jgi:hypothetical protein
MNSSLTPPRRSKPLIDSLKSIGAEVFDVVDGKAVQRKL